MVPRHLPLPGIYVVMVLTSACIVACAGVRADIITIDGSSADWSNPDRIYSDPTGDSGGSSLWDIRNNQYLLDWSTLKCNFAIRTVAAMSPLIPSTAAWLMINVDQNATTGGPVKGWIGVDYYAQLKPNGNTLVWNAWNGSAWTNPSSGVLGKLGTGSDANFIEWSVPWAAIGGQTRRFYWQVYLQSGSGGSAYTDSSPDVNTPNYIGDLGWTTPEPCSAALLLVCVPMLGWLRRRKTRR